MAGVPALPDLVGLRGRPDAWLIGAGGKTSLMYALARTLLAEGATVITTTSTHIRRPLPADSPCVVLGEEPGALLAEVRTARSAHAHVTVAAGALAADVVPGAPGAPGAEAKLRGLPLATLAALVRAELATHVLVEADGAAHRPCKAHAAHEPVVGGAAALVIVVVGAEAVGAPLDEAHVHRAALAGAWLGLAAGARLSAADVAKLVLHPAGWPARVAPRVEVTACVVGTADGALAAREDELLAALRRADSAGRCARIVACRVRPGAGRA